MNAKELRIGNLVWVYSLNDRDGNDTKIATINSISESCFQYTHEGNKFNHASVKPIPLTEEWLKKFGLTRRDSKFGYWYTTRQYIFEQTLLKDAWSLRQILTKNESLCIRYKIVHVHQLQNLYFALTGTELTLTP